jgi:uncharacterized membrane protein HdeD (DUF308 family)
LRALRKEYIGDVISRRENERAPWSGALQLWRTIMMSVLVENWWAFVARGVFAVLFGLIALFMPGVTMLSLVFVFAAYVIADGIFAIVAAVRSADARKRWGLLALEGLVSIAAGLVAVAWPGVTVIFFVAIVAVWALITGSLMLGLGLNMAAGHGRGWVIIGALASVIYGIALVVAPALGALVLTWWIGAYALVFGIAIIVFAFDLRAKFKASGLGKILAGPASHAT